MHIINPMRHALSVAFLISFVAGNMHATVFTVNTTSDSVLNTGSLRYAITNLAAGANTIQFDIPTSDPGYNATTQTWTIQPATDLPNIVQQVTISGYSFFGAVYNTLATPNTLAQGDNAKLSIVINGSNYTVGNGFATGNGLHFAAGSSNSVVTGLVINQWLGNGIFIDGTAGSVNGIAIIGNFIGTDSTGMIQMANRNGIGILGTTNPCNNTTIGTPVPANRNIINGSFGNFSPAITTNTIFCGNISSQGNTGATIVNNYIGTNASGTAALGNSLFGITLASETICTIGGISATSRNVISGQTAFGICLAGATLSTIQGNYIGTDVTGSQPIGNLNSGIYLGSFTAPTTGNTISNNVISENGAGITLGDATAPGTILNTVQANKIGTDFSGTVGLANSYFGIAVQDGQNTITGNVISGNRAGGVMFNGTTFATGNSVNANLIGTDITGTKVIPNGGNGVQIGLNGGFGGAASTTIG